MTSLHRTRTDYIYIYIYIYIYVCVCMNVCVCACVCVYGNTAYHVIEQLKITARLPQGKFLHRGIPMLEFVGVCLCGVNWP